MDARIQNSESFAAAAEDLAGVHIVDVRRKGVFDQADTILPGARWRDPGEVNDWCAQLPKDVPVVVYCVHGHEVSRATATSLRAAGIDARFLRGGIEGWKSAGRPLAPKQA